MQPGHAFRTTLIMGKFTSVSTVTPGPGDAVGHVNRCRPAGVIRIADPAIRIPVAALSYCKPHDRLSPVVGDPDGQAKGVQSGRIRTSSADPRHAAHQSRVISFGLIRRR